MSHWKYVQDSLDNLAQEKAELAFGEIVLLEQRKERWTSLQQSPKLDCFKFSNGEDRVGQITSREEWADE